MTVYFMGGELNAFNPSNSSTIEVTSSGDFNSSFTRCALSCGGSSGHYGESVALTLPDEFYFHCDLTWPLSTSGTGKISFYAGATEVFRLQSDNANLQMMALISGVMTNVGSAVPWAETSLETVDLYVDGNTVSGTARLYLSGTLQATASADLSQVTGITKLRVYDHVGYSQCISQVIISDESTVGWRLVTRYPNGNGTSGDWTGTYADVDEIVSSDVDFVNSSTNGQVEQFTQTGPAISGYTIRAVGVYARAKCGGSGPQNLQLSLRSSGTDYFSASQALNTGYAAYGNIWDTNPATSAAWLSTAIDALQPGVKAIT